MLSGAAQDTAPTAEGTKKTGASQRGALHNPTLRVLMILQMIDQNPEGVTLSQIGERLHLPKGTISPILKTLIATGFVSCEQSLYRIGLESFQLGLNFGSGKDVLEMIRSQMQSIVQEVGEICQCGVLDGLNVLYVLRENSDNSVSIISEVGKRIPAHLTGIGKALLAEKDEAWIKSAYDGYVFEQYTPQTIHSLDRLLSELSEARRTGVAFENEESKQGICCLAVPLIIDGAARAAISVTVPKYRMTEEKQKKISSTLLEKKRLIEEISKVQGYQWS